MGQFSEDVQVGAGTVAADLMLGVAGAVTFVVAAILLTVLSSFYSQWLDITYELPIVFSVSFLAEAGLVLAGAPCAAVLAGRRLRGEQVHGSRAGSTNVVLLFVVGAISGLVMTGSVWVVLGGRAAGGNLLDWPHSLWFLEVALAGALAGALIGTVLASQGGGRSRLGSPGHRTAVVVGLSAMLLSIVVLVTLLPFLQVWQAKRIFQVDASREIGKYFIMPPGLEPAVSDEGRKSEAGDANRVFSAVESWEAQGEPVTVMVSGERDGSHIRITSINGHVQAHGAAWRAIVDWQQTGADSTTVAAARDLAGAISSEPLSLTGTSGTGGHDRSILFHGGRIDAIARPASSEGGGAGIYMTFVVSMRN